jgi:chemotaxis family two-component system sensor kinase Cph1
VRRRTQVAAQSHPDSETEGLTRAADLVQTRTRLVEQFSATGDLVQALLRGTVTALDLVPAGAAALHLEGVTSTLGDAPAVTRIQLVMEQLRSYRTPLPMATDCLAADHPQIAGLLPGVAGLLIVPVDGGRGCLLWFRPEIEETTEPLGDQSEADPESALSPRTSPSAPKSSVWRRAQPWEGLAEAATRLSRDLDGAILRNLQSELAHFGFHDALTGLSNNRLLMDRIEHALAGPGRGAGVALLLVDLDSFKAINDSLGHDRGDEVLIQAADRLRSVTRDSDTVARLAGDEFAILAVGADRASAPRIAERMLAALRPPFTIAGSPLRVTCAIGVAEGAADDTAADLMRRAETAMYRAKRAGTSHSVE